MVVIRVGQEMFPAGIHGLANAYRKFHEQINPYFMKSFAYTVDFELEPKINPYSIKGAICRQKGYEQKEKYVCNEGKLEIATFGVPKNGLPKHYNCHAIDWQGLSAVLLDFDLNGEFEVFLDDNIKKFLLKNGVKKIQPFFKTNSDD